MKKIMLALLLASSTFAVNAEVVEDAQEEQVDTRATQIEEEAPEALTRGASGVNGSRGISEEAADSQEDADTRKIEDIAEDIVEDVAAE